MTMFQLTLVALVLLFAAGGAYMVLAGPSPDKESTRRLKAVRYRHSENTKDKVEAQMRKAVAARRPKIHAIAGSGSRI